MEFVQDGITTLHDFGEATSAVDLDGVAVIVPLTADDVGEAGVRHTFDVLSSLDAVEVIVPLRADGAIAHEIGRWLREQGVADDVIWCNGPRMTRLLNRAGVPSSGGKGLDVWLGLGLAAADHDRLVVHDADSNAYAGAHVPRLAWPLNRGYDFVKGYYARIEDDRLFGRLVRLFWCPLIDVIGQDRAHPLVEYLDAFRYPLAGEFALTAETATRLRLHPGWGLEMGMLGETFVHVGVDRTAQVDLGRHRHDHRPVVGPDGLAAMATEVAGAIFAMLDAHDIRIERERLGAEYERKAMEYIERYAVDAEFNGLEYDAFDERDQVRRYRVALEAPGVPSKLPAFGDTVLDPERIRRATTLEGTRIADHGVTRSVKCDGSG